jgi:NADH-quinone oxidoreductase subunit M
MFLIIGIWGGERRIYSTFKFFLYTLAGSVFMLLAVIFMYWEVGTSSIPVLLQHEFSYNNQIILWLAFFASFVVKIPMWPFHTWLPDAHVEAPTAGSVILAGVLLKLAGYGFIRFSITMFPDASHYFAPMIYALSIIAIIFHIINCTGSGRYEKIDSIFICCSYGFCHIGYIYFHNSRD